MTSSPTRVCHLLVSTAVGGGPKQVFETIRRLPDADFQWVVAAPADGPYFARFAGLGPAHDLPLERLSARTLARVVGLIRRHRIDVVHSHGKGAGLYARLAGALTGTPAIHTFHGIHVSKYGRTGRALYLGLERWLSRLSFRVINVSESQARTGEALRLWPPGRAVVICNGIDAEETRRVFRDQGLDRAALGLPGDAPVIGTIARLDPVKGVDVLVEALARLRPRVPGILGLVVGQGSEMARLRTQAAREGLDGAVVFAGEIDEGVRALRAMDVYVSTSRSEGLPLSLLEAMACGVPVVVTRIPPHAEIVIDGRTGLLACVDDPGDVADKVAALMEDGPRRHACAAAAAADVALRYAISATASRLAGLYRLAAGRP